MEGTTVIEVLLLSRYGWLGASSRVRSYQYFSYLKAHGINVTVSPLLNDDYLRHFYCGRASQIKARVLPYLRRLYSLFKTRHFDFIWMEKELFSWLPALGEMVLERSGIPYIVDYDDATFHRYDSHPNRLVQKFLGGKIDSVMRHAAIVIVGNEYLMERARKARARHIEYLPSVVDTERYIVKKHSESSTFTIGWIGTPQTVKYLETIVGALSEWDKKNVARLVTVGADSFELDDMRVEHHPWSQDSEVSEIQEFDVGIMPISDNFWEKGKCGYKLIQYMACGKPVIASPVGANSKIVEHGVNGYLANSKREWLEALDILFATPELRYEMGVSGRGKVENEFCLQVTAPRLLNMLRSARQERYR